MYKSNQYPYSTYMELHEGLIAKVSQYVPPKERLARLADVPVLFMVGISGAGKNTLSRALLARYPDYYTEFITHTTRQPRENHGVLETNNVDYYFISLAEAEKMLDNHEYVEANLYSGNVYGTSISELERAKAQHKRLIGDVDVNGVAHFMQALPGCKPIFILPPSYEVWQERLMTRYKGEVDERDWRNRVYTARREIEHALGNSYYYLLVNDDITKAVEDIHAIATGSVTERRPAHALAVAKDILNKLDTVL